MHACNYNIDLHLVGICLTTDYCFCFSTTQKHALFSIKRHVNTFKDDSIWC